jgi:lysozyme
MITIGWGHAEPISKSKYKIGQSISSDEANVLLTDDLTMAADGVRRMFKDWNESGDYVPINQDMFDALVSLAYNSGVYGIRNSKICRELRKKNYKEAGELIKKFKVSSKFRGLFERRSRESRLFLSFLNENDN